MPVKQPEFKVMEGDRIPDVDEAAEEYRKLREKSGKISDQKLDALRKLIEVCEANQAKMSKRGDGTRVYRYDDWVVEFSDHKPTVALKAFKEKDAEVEPDNE